MHWWDLITFESILFLDNLIECLWLTMNPLQMKSWARCLRGCAFFPFHWKSYIFSIFFLIYFGTVYVWPMYHSLDKKIWFKIIFLRITESVTLFQMSIFYYTYTYFAQIGVLEDRLPKLTPSILMEIYDHSFCPCWSIVFSYSSPKGLVFEKFIFELDGTSYRFKIICILLTLIRVEGRSAPLVYYNILVTGPNFLKFGDFSYILSAIKYSGIFFSKFELVLAVSALFHGQVLFFVYVFCWNNEYILGNIRWFELRRLRKTFLITYFQ